MIRYILHYLCDSPSPYNAELFRAIEQEPEIDLLVHYRRNKITSHPWQSDLLAGYRSRNYSLRFGVDWQLIKLGLADPGDTRKQLFFVAGWNTPTALLLMIILALRKKPYLIWTDTPDLNKHRAAWFAVLRTACLRFVFRYARFVGGAGRQALNVLAKMGARSEKLINFPYWIDLRRFKNFDRQRCFSLSPECVAPIRLLSTGRIENKIKGHDIAVRALASQTKEHQCSFEYRIAGTGVDECALAKLASDLGIGGQVKILGWLEPDQLLNELHQADVLLHPSPVHEPYGVAVIEAMAAGLTVLASDATCAALDRIEHGKNGLIHRAGDVEELAQQISLLLQSPDTITVLGHAAQETACQWPMERAIKILKSLVTWMVR